MRPLYSAPDRLRRPARAHVPATGDLREEGTMPTYILLSTLTPEGRQTLHKNPDRLEEADKEIAEFGCKVIAQYGVLGPMILSALSKPQTTRRSRISRSTGVR